MKEALRFGIFDWIEASETRSAREIFEHKLELAAAADRLGFHAYLVAEHQGTPLSVNGAPSVLLSAMFQRTRRLRAGALTFCLPWHNPWRWYHEVCMLDHLSGGRLELGVGRGVSPIESLIFELKSIDESREKYRETLEIFFAASVSRTLNFRGKYYTYRDTELHIKPLQQPWPPLWFPSSNRDSIDFSARHGYHTALLARLADCKAMFEQYRETWERHRNDPGRHNAHAASPILARTLHLVIAEDGAEAERLGLEAHRRWSSRINHLTSKLGRAPVHNTEPSGPDSVQPLVAGSPRAVAERVQEVLRVTGANAILGVFSFGDLPPPAALASLELFAREVRPALAGSAPAG